MTAYEHGTFCGSLGLLFGFQVTALRHICLIKEMDCDLAKVFTQKLIAKPCGLLNHSGEGLVCNREG